ncbi:MAG TPA: peptidyl-prolyl cis-trans isomerase [Anaeromyxobacter sp.]
MRALRVTLAVATLAAASGCSRCGAGTKDAATAARAVATVNGEILSADALARELRDARVGTEDGGGGLDVLRRRVLDELVDRAVLLQEARARSVVVGQDQVERAFLRIRSEYPGTHFDDLLAQERLSQTELKARLKDQLTLERLFEQEVFPRVQVVDADVERYYVDHAQDYQDPERVRVSQIVVATRDEAVQIRDRVRRAPQTFADVARKSSIGPEGRNGGDLGYIGKGSGFPEVFDACFTMPLNVVSDVIPSPYGFHLFKVLDRKPAHKRPLEQARGEIQEKLTRERRAQAQEDYVRTLRQRAKIEIDEKVLASVTP